LRGSDGHTVVGDLMLSTIIKLTVVRPMTLQWDPLLEKEAHICPLTLKTSVTS